MRCFCAVISIVSLAWGSPALSAAEALTPDAADNTVVPGKRVGAITAHSSLSVLRALYGKANIGPKMQTQPSGDTSPGARLFAGTDRQLDLVWDEEAREKRVVEVRIIGSAWVLENGLKTGLPLGEAEKMIGKPVKATTSDGEGGVIAFVDSAVPGTGFGLGFVSSPTNEPKPAPEPKRAAANGKKAAPPPSPARNSNTVVTKIVISFR